MADTHYYVSQQNGNDANLGTSAEQAWATISQAAATVTANAGGHTYIHIGPGTYREKPVPTNSGLSDTEKIIYAGDPECIHLLYDYPGIVRITSCVNNEEVAPTGNCLDWTGKTKLELTDCYVDYSKDSYALLNVETTRRVVATGYNGISGGSHYRTTVFAYGNSGFRDFNYCESCILYGTANYGFYLTNDISNGYYECCNCAAYGAFSGAFYGYNSTNKMLNCYNCTAVGSTTGFLYCKGSDNMTACTYACRSALLLNHANLSPNVPNAIDKCYVLIQWNMSHNQDCTPLNPLYGYLFVDDKIQLYPYARPQVISNTVKKVIPFDNFNYGYSRPNQTLSNANTHAGTPTMACTCKGFAIAITTFTTGAIIVALEKYDGATWQVQKSKTLTPADVICYKSNYISYANVFDWDTGSGDDQLTTTANLWRLRVTPSPSASGSYTHIAALGEVQPPQDQLDILNNEIYISGKKRMLGSVYQSPAVLDYQTYNTSPPSISLPSRGHHSLDVPVRADVQINISYKVRHNGVVSGSEPQLILKGLDIATQTATHSAGADTWETLTVSATPGRNGVLTCYLVNRDDTHITYFSDPTVTEGVI